MLLSFNLIILLFDDQAAFDDGDSSRRHTPFSKNPSTRTSYTLHILIGSDVHPTLVALEVQASGVIDAQTNGSRFGRRIR